jgi:hydantoinase/carbamoylase family amidase
VVQAQTVARHVVGERLLGRLDALSAIGGQADGGVTRIAFSDEERAATDLVAGWMRDAGLTVAFDWFGNMFGSTDGNRADTAVSMAGSHLDTVPNGGRFDGALGVVAALESVLAMRAAGHQWERPLEVVVWRCEEPVRFSQGKVGSSLFAGQLPVADLQPVENPPFVLSDALDADSERPRRAAGRTVATCLELHIEQGRRLESARRRIGVVTAVAAPIRLRITMRGHADHSGATPMDDRRDALCAAAEVVLAVEQAARDEASNNTVATATNVICRPGTINVIPGEAAVMVDVRGIDLTSMERLVAAVSQRAQASAERRGVALAVTVLSRGVPTPFSGGMVRLLADVTRSLGYDPLLLPSGAGHDTQCLAAMAEVGMLFVPSVGGISHAPEELTHPDDVVAGVRALVGCWAALTGATYGMHQYDEPPVAK